MLPRPLLVITSSNVSVQQEQVHIATIEGILSHFNTPIIPPCLYQFPVDSTASFLQLAQIITTVGIGGVLEIATLDAVTDPAVIQGVASIVTVEARHDAFFRTAVDSTRAPNPAPFDTRISGVWALNLALPFVVPDSCPSLPNVPILPPLNVVTITPGVSSNGTATDGTGTVTFSAPAGFGSNSTASLFAAWVNQVNVPVFTPATVGGNGNIQTTVPKDMAGVAFVALTTKTDATDVDTLTSETLAGPAVVILN